MGVLLGALVACTAGTTPAAPSSPSGPSPADTTPPAPRGVAGGIDFLLAQQSADGAWRSDRYPGMRDGASLTALALAGLSLSGAPLAPEVQAAAWRGARHLFGMAGGDGVVRAPLGLNNPVYTASMLLRGVAALPQPGAPVPGRDVWLGLLQQHQLAEAHGWSPSDPDYGGFGYATDLPKKPKPGELAGGLLESNISATAWALEAMRATDRSAADEICKKALTFVERRQNFAETAGPNKKTDPRRDGGFTFVRDDPVRNKAGPIGAAGEADPHFRSYGSATADGLRAYIACGRNLDEPRVRAARAWLTERFRVDAQPGDFGAAQEDNRHAVYFYYVASLGQALGAARLEGTLDGVPYREALRQELLRRQRPDGSWANDFVLVQEDEPIVATALALIGWGR